jgi:protein SCO1/2
MIVSFCATVTSVEALPDDSIYQIASTWVDQNNQSVEIESLSGKIQVIAFVYTYCEHSCPIIMERLKQINKKTPEANQKDIHFSLFTLDPKRDTPEQLKRFEHKHKLDEKQWSLYNGDADDVLELAALLGVRYKPMNNDNDDIAHSNMITLLDKQGRIVHQVKGFNENLDSILKTIIDLSTTD